MHGSLFLSFVCIVLLSQLQEDAFTMVDTYLGFVFMFGFVEACAISVLGLHARLTPSLDGRAVCSKPS